MSNETHQAIALEAAEQIFEPLPMSKRKAIPIILAAIERSHEPEAQPQRREAFPNLEARNTPENVPELPWFVSHDDATDCPPHTSYGLAKIDTGRETDWPVARLLEWPTAKFIVEACAAYAKREQPPATDDKLLPCPFCGSSAEFGDDGEGGEFITCTNQMCLASSQIKYPCKTDVKPLLTEVWNNRVTDDRVKEQGFSKPLAERIHQFNKTKSSQEWTEQSLFTAWQDYVDRPNGLCEFFVAIADKINAALADGREITDIGRRWKENSSLESWFPFAAKELAELKQQLADEREKRETTLRLNSELVAQLLQTQAAIAEVKRGTLTQKNWEILKTIDLSAVDKHDAEVRKPLVDALDELLDTSKDVSVGVFPTEAHLRVRAKAVKLLAKMKGQP